MINIRELPDHPQFRLFCKWRQNREHDGETIQILFDHHDTSRGGRILIPPPIECFGGDSTAITMLQIFHLHDIPALAGNQASLDNYQMYLGVIASKVCEDAWKDLKKILEYIEEINKTDRQKAINLRLEFYQTNWLTTLIPESITHPDECFDYPLNDWKELVDVS